MPNRRSPWFDGTTPPVHPGVYEREYNAPKELRVYGMCAERARFFVAYAYWDGTGWGMWHHTTAGALENYMQYGVHINSATIRWRGCKRKANHDC